MKDQPIQDAPDFLFPKDGGRHVDALHEWWYLNSHFETNIGRQYGLFVSFSLPHRMYFSLVDKSGKHVVKRFVKRTTVKASTSCLNLETDNNWWRKIAGTPFRYVIYLHQDSLSLRLELLSRKTPLFVNRSGHIKFGLLGSSRYYALTNIKILGTLQLDENRFEVKGIGWMDRQWGNWDYGGIGSWNWFSIQLSNNIEILAGQCFHPITGSPIMTLCNMIDNEGRTKIYDKLRIKYLKTWRSPRTGLVYEAGWKVSLQQDTNLLVSPVIVDQEIHRGFWEGCCEVRGILQGQPVTGVGYAEQSYHNHAGHLVRLLYILSVGMPPFRRIGQLILRRVDFNAWRLLQYERQVDP